MDKISENILHTIANTAKKLMKEHHLSAEEAYQTAVDIPFGELPETCQDSQSIVSQLNNIGVISANQKDNDICFFRVYTSMSVSSKLRLLRLQLSSSMWAAIQNGSF